MHWIYAHLIGDYIIQNDWMAAGKKRSSWICAVHVATYMLPFYFCHLGAAALALIAAEHFLQDRTSIVVAFMRLHGQAEFAKPPMAPWSVIVVDNVLHVLWIAAVVSTLHS